MTPRLDNPFYYLDNFQAVLRWVGQRYGDMLDQAETDFMQRFPSLPQAARALLARMVMRKGSLFRLGKLRYPEIGDPRAACAPLVEAGWVDPAPVLSLEQLFALLTRAEIAQAFGAHLPRRQLAKSAQWDCLAKQYPDPRPFAGWWPDARDSVQALVAKPMCERFRLMFFGTLSQDWSEFVLADLGLYRYEQVDFPASSRVLQCRRDVDDYLLLHGCRERFRAGAAPDDILADVPPQAYSNGWIEQRRARLLFLLARQYEKTGQWQAAYGLYMQNAGADAKSRAVRVLEQDGRPEEALALAETLAREPAGEAQAQQLARIVPRLLRKLGRPAKPRSRPAQVDTLLLDLPRPTQPLCVEEVARAWLERPGAPAYYVENTLVNALFGLLCWDALFAPMPGAFFHPFQNGPADLHSADFLPRRQALFDDCLAQLDTGRYRRTILRNHARKAGLQCAFVAWNIIDRQVLRHALRCIPASHLKKWFQRMLADLPANRSGFPDLVQFWPAQRRYRMVEVKGPGDRLQDNQVRWLDYCAAHGMPVAVCRVQWAPAT